MDSNFFGNNQPAPFKDPYSDQVTVRRLRSEVASLKIRMTLHRNADRRKSSKLTHAHKRLLVLERVCDAKEHENERLYGELSILKNELSDWKRKAEELEEELENCKREEREPCKVITTKHQGGHFTNEVKECTFKLLDCNVSTGQIAPVMQAVLQFAGVQFGDLPKRSTINEWHVSRLILAQNQVAELLGPSQNLMLLSTQRKPCFSDIRNRRWKMQ
jgi:hypothetical protein